MPEANKIYDTTRELVSNGMMSHNQDTPDNHLLTIHSLSVFPHYPLIVQMCASFFSFKKSSKFTLILLTLILSSSIWVAQDTDLLPLMKDKTKPETPIEF